MTNRADNNKNTFAIPNTWYGNSTDVVNVNMNHLNTWFDSSTVTDPVVDDIVVNRPGKPPLRVGETLERIMERLAILEPDFDKMERYPALREAYNNYKLIEAMVTGDDNQQ